jgi:hypothetical protein
MKINRKISQQQSIPLSEAEIQGLLHPAQANLGYFCVWFQSLQLPSTQRRSSCSNAFCSKSRVMFEVYIQLNSIFNLSHFKLE